MAVIDDYTFIEPIDKVWKSFDEIYVSFNRFDEDGGRFRYHGLTTMGNLNHTIALYRFSEDLKRFNTAWGTYVNDRFYVFSIKDKEVEKLEGDRKDGTEKY